MDKLADVAVIYLNDKNLPVDWTNSGSLERRASGDWCFSPSNAIKKDYAIVINNSGTDPHKVPYIAEVYKVSGVLKVAKQAASTAKDKVRFILSGLPANDLVKSQLLNRLLLAKKAQGDTQGVANGELLVDGNGALQLWRRPTSKGASSPKRIA